jgi:hypothetical protein
MADNLISAADAKPRFPVLCFTNFMEVMFAVDFVELTTWDGRLLERFELEAGLELVDADGRCFVVRTADILRQKGSWLRNGFDRLRKYPAQYQVELGLEPSPIKSLGQVKDHILACIEKYPENWCYDIYHIPYGIPVPVEDALALVEDGQSVAELCDPEYVDRFMGYCGPYDVEAYHRSGPSQDNPDHIDPSHIAEWQAAAAARIAARRARNLNS